MNQNYRSVRETARIELIEKKSRFIAACGPIESQKDAQVFLQRQKEAYTDASHHAYAWILGRQTSLQKYSDDGEPQGTAGLPAMHVLQKNSLWQTIVVITRYFGGTELGAGGLSRAYGTSAARAVKAAGQVTYHFCSQLQVTVEYGDLATLQHALEQRKIAHAVTGYGMDAEVCVTVPTGAVDDLKKLCANVTQGAALVELKRQLHVPLPPPDPPPKAKASYQH